MHSPIPVTSILLAYLYFVLKLGPKLMENRPAYDLKNVLVIYNAYQVIFSTWLCLQAFKYKEAIPYLINNSCSAAPNKIFQMAVSFIHLKLIQAFSISIFILVVKWSLVVLFFKSNRTLRHSFLRLEEETKPSNFPPRLSSFLHHVLLLVLSEIHPRCARSYYRFFKFPCTCCDVFLLFLGCFGT